MIKIFDPAHDFRKEQRHYSPTKMADYERCPRMYLLRHVKKLPEPKSHELEVGGVAHDLIAAYDRHLVERKLQTDVTAIDAIVAETIANPPEHRGAKRTYSADAARDGEAVFRAFVESHILERPEQVLGIEELIGLDLGDGIIWWFKVDRIDGIPNGGQMIGRIVDYKSDHRIRPLSEVEKDTQLLDYAWGYNAAYPGLFSWFEVALSFIRWRVTVGPVPVSLDQVRAHEKHVRARIARVETDKKFKPTPGDGCAFCGFWHDCPALETLGDAGGQIIITTAEEAQRCLNQLALIERQASAHRDALKAWCNANGLVVGNGVQIGFFKSGGEGAIDDAKAFAEVLQQAGKDPWPWLRGPDSRSLSKLLKSNGLGEALKPLIKDNTSTRFMMKKLSEEAAAP